MVMAADPLLASLVAVIVAVPPSATSVTRPVCDTVAIVGALDTHATVRPVSGLPLASLSVAVSCTVPPTGMVAEAGLTATVATGTMVTVIVAVLVFVSLVAVIVAEPAATPVTSPLLVTVATAGALLDQVTTRPLKVLPALSFAVALSWVVAPTSTPAEAGLIARDATGTFVTVIAAVPLFVSLVAMIVVVPGARPVINPVASTLATVGAELLQVKARPTRVSPRESRARALSCTVRPARRV